MTMGCLPWLCLCVFFVARDLPPVLGDLLFVTNCIPCAKYQKARPDPENTKILNYLCLTPFLCTNVPLSTTLSTKSPGRPKLHLHQRPRPHIPLIEFGKRVYLESKEKGEGESFKLRPLGHNQCCFSRFTTFLADY